MQTNQTLESNSPAYPVLLVEQVTNQVFNQIYPITGLETSYFPKFMKSFWAKYPSGKILSDTELLELCFDTADSIAGEQKTANVLIQENDVGVDQELVLGMLFQPSEAVFASRDDLIRFPKTREYDSLAAELITELYVNEETFDKYVEQKKLKKKHLNRIGFVSNTNYSNINNFITHLSCVCGFLFSDLPYKGTLLRALYYIFFKKVATLNEDSILLFVNSPDKKKQRGWICLDFSMNYTTIGYLINFEERYIYDYKEHMLVNTNQIIDKKEFIQFIEGEVPLPNQVQIVADKIKLKTHEAHLEAFHPEKFITEPNFILNQIQQLSLLQTNENPAPTLPINIIPELRSDVSRRSKSDVGKMTRRNSSARQRVSSAGNLTYRVARTGSGSSGLGNINNNNTIISSETVTSHKSISPQTSTGDLLNYNSYSAMLNHLEFFDVNNSFMGKYPQTDAYPLINTPTLSDYRQFILSSNDLSNFEKMNGPSGIVVKAVLLVHPLKENLTESEQDLMLQEIHKLSSIPSHVNILKHYGICIQDRRHFLITEFAPFCLSDIIQRREEIPIMKCLHLAKGIASGMQHLAAFGIIHRHLEPNNIELTEDMSVKICDFGLKRFMENRNTNLLVSLKWISPEALRTHQWSPNCDVWSFGITLWQLIHLQEPYGSLEPKAATFEVIKGLSPQITRNSYPFITSLIQTCLQHNSESRPHFRQIHEMLDLFQRKLDERNWFYPAMDRSQAEAILAGAQSSSFLVRRSVDGQSLALSRFDKGSIVHERILSKDNRFYLEKYPEDTFYSLYDLVSSPICFGLEPVGFILALRLSSVTVEGSDKQLI